MSKQQHTPGPWEVIGQHVFTKLGGTNAHGSKAHDRDGWNIATINPWACTNQDGEDEDMPVSETMANASLIAAAPDQNEALELTQILLERLGLEHSDEYQRNAAALAKARGES